MGTTRLLVYHILNNQPDELSSSTATSPEHSPTTATSPCRGSPAEQPQASTIQSTTTPDNITDEDMVYNALDVAAHTPARERAILASGLLLPPPDRGDGSRQLFPEASKQPEEEQQVKPALQTITTLQQVAAAHQQDLDQE